MFWVVSIKVSLYFVWIDVRFLEVLVSITVWYILLLLLLSILPRSYSLGFLLSTLFLSIPLSSMLSHYMVLISMFVWKVVFDLDIDDDNASIKLNTTGRDMNLNSKTNKYNRGKSRQQRSTYCWSTNSYIKYCNNEKKKYKISSSISRSNTTFQTNMERLSTINKE